MALIFWVSSSQGAIAPTDPEDKSPDRVPRRQFLAFSPQ
ncbi:hypothetical protein OSCI_4110014 [Kamptonema sp. PCC 6506]|nr:hypothetical protein OSCI_4110014 [Kamptonema sp. PCC 6506]